MYICSQHIDINTVGFEPGNLHIMLKYCNYAHKFVQLANIIHGIFSTPSLLWSMSVCECDYVFIFVVDCMSDLFCLV